jgi:recombination protein RecT
MSDSTAIQPQSAPENGRGLKAFLMAQSERIAAVCDRSIAPEKIIQLAAICAYRTPELALCERASVLASVIQSASLGLDLHPSSGEAYLIPRRNKMAGVLECHFQAGYQGLCKLARQAGTRYIHARVVHANDAFSWRYSPELEMSHEPSRDANPGIVIGAYAVARTESGDLIGEFMTFAEIEAIRRKSQKPDRGPWLDFFEEMAKKTVCRRLCKWLSKSPKLVEALASIDQDFQLDPPPDSGPDGTPEAAPKVERVAAVVAARAAALPKPNGESHPEPEPVAKIAEQVKQVSDPLPPRNGSELESYCDQHGCRGWFSAYGTKPGYPRKLVFWSEQMIRLAWAEFVRQSQAA